jgi:hypothetical protein
MIEKLGITPIRREPHGRLMSIVLTKQLEEVEDQRNEMLESIITHRKWYVKSEWITNDFDWLIEKATGLTWAEVKERIE